MSTSNTGMIIPKKSQEGIIAFQKQCYYMLNSSWNLREQMRQVDLAYIRENDFTLANQRARIANKYGDADRLQNVTVPVVMPSVESAVTYQTSVFLTGVPLFGVVSDPQYEDQALQLASVIDDQATKGGWVRHLQMLFRDGYKYNFGALEVTWDRRTTADLVTDVSFSAKQAKPKEIIWEGNCIKRLDPYNCFFDLRVTPTEIPQKGEFFGYTEIMSRTRLKQFIAQLPDKLIDNITAAFESGLGSIVPGGIESYYIPQINPNALIKQEIRQGTNWLSWAGITGADQGKIRYQNVYELTTLYGRIIPSDFNLRVPGANTPQVWKFIIVNHQVLIYAERQTNAHDLIPTLIIQPQEDGLGYQTKSLANNVKPIQDVTSGLMNSVIASRRRAISDRVLYDPSRINESAINSPNPSAKIPVRPAAYGKPLGEAVYPFPYNDNDSATILQQLPIFSRFADMITGQNPVRQGQFVKGNKTQKEFESVMGNANGRDQSVSILLESQLFTPLKEILKINILQYQGKSSVYSREKETQVDVDPVALRKAVLNFKISDGLTPTDKLINADTLAVALQQIGTSPQIAAGYNIAPLFSYLMKTQGAELSAFEKPPAQVAYEQAMAQWQQLVMQLQKQNPEMKADQYPPAPQPQQFGWNPQQSLNTPEAQTSNTQPGGTNGNTA